MSSPCEQDAGQNTPNNEITQLTYKRLIQLFGMRVRHMISVIPFACYSCS